MLDFYLLPDDKPMPRKLDSLEYAGGLEYDVYDRLVSKRIIDSRFDYYSDFRWSNHIILQIYSRINEINLDSDLSKVKSILDKANAKGYGLIALAD